MTDKQKAITFDDANGKTWTLNLDINAMCLCEEQLGGTFGEILQRAQRLSAKDIRVIIWAALKGAHADITLDQAGDLVGEMGGISGMLETLLGDGASTAASAQIAAAEATSKLRRAGRPKADRKH